MVFVNKMDRVGADFYKVLKDIKQKLNAKAIPLVVPVGAEDNFNGLIDLVEMTYVSYQDDLGKDIVSSDEIPAELKDSVAEWREILLEAAAEQEEELMDKYLETGDLSADEIRKGIRMGTVNNEIVPMSCGTAFKNKGVQLLLDYVIDFMPSPIDVESVTGIDPNTDEEIVRKPSDNDPFAALAFKVQTDPYVGKLTWMRVYSGTLDAGSYAYNSTKQNKERIGRLLKMHSNKREEVETVYAGDIVAAVGLKDTTTADTVCDENSPIILESMDFPEPVIHIAIEPKTKADQEKMSAALQKLAEEDPTFRVKIDHETGQTIIAGMGELHLEILVDRLLREFNVDANVGKPQVAYKETIRGTVEQEGKYIKQSGGRGQYGHVWLKIEPSEKGKIFEFENKITGGVIPKEYIPAVEKGAKEALEGGILAGYHCLDVKVTLYDGSFHDVDSSEMAFKIAGAMALKDGAKKASPVLLEPVMDVEVDCPEDNMGDVIGDLNSRRGRIEGMETEKGMSKVRARVPLGEMFGYSTSLRSKTQGRGTYTMQFSDYEECPKNVAEAIVKGNH